MKDTNTSLSNHWILGLDKWKKEIKSPDYDWELIKARLDQLREIRLLKKGQSAMIFALRTSLARNIGDMGNPKVRPLFLKKILCIYANRFF